MLLICFINFEDDKENSVVQWQQLVNGWQVSLAVVNQILREISHGSGDLENVSSFIAKKRS